LEGVEREVGGQEALEEFRSAGGVEEEEVFPFLEHGG
jgi:hypothetical protein